ncbi:MAG: D-alanyl-D-alanine carboxypeptidase [Veillonella parvula]
MTKKSSISTALKAVFITLGFSFSSMAEVNVASITQYLPEGASASIIAKNLNKDQIIADYNGSTFMLPASTQKVFTAVAAKLVLGDAFQFETSLLSNGKIQNNVLEGDLVVQFTGDPDLTSGQLYSLLSNLIIDIENIPVTKLLLLHYPPFNESNAPSGFTDLMKQYKVDICIFGHLHDQISFNRIPKEFGTTKLELVSADYLDFMLKQII